MQWSYDKYRMKFRTRQLLERSTEGLKCVLITVNCGSREQATKVEERFMKLCKNSVFNGEAFSLWANMWLCEQLEIQA